MANKSPAEAILSPLKVGLIASGIALSAALLTACDDGPATSSSSPAKSEARISGMVSDLKGSVNNGKLEVKDQLGNTVNTSEFQDGRYTVTVPAGTKYPITITAYPPAGSMFPEPIKAAVTSPIADRQDLSPVSTYVVDNAITLGGLTEQNIAKASGGAIGMRQSQGVSAGAGGSAGGPGNSGGGAGAGGHAGHKMADMPSGHDMSTMDQSSAPAQSNPAPAAQPAQSNPQ